MFIRPQAGGLLLLSMFFLSGCDGSDYEIGDQSHHSEYLASVDAADRITVTADAPTTTMVLDAARREILRDWLSQGKVVRKTPKWEVIAEIELAVGSSKSQWFVMQVSRKELAVKSAPGVYLAGLDAQKWQEVLKK
jgi:hypothetical protein